MKINLTTRFLAITAACLVLFAAAGCAVLPKAVAIEGSERDRVLQQSEPIADEMFNAMNEHDYAGFSKYFDETMKKALDENAFNTMTRTFDDKIGAYLSREVEKVESVENLYVVSYKARYEKEEVVSVRLTVRDGDPVQVSGLWFDSPMLREDS